MTVGPRGLRCALTVLGLGLAACSEHAAGVGVEGVPDVVAHDPRAASPAGGDVEPDAADSRDASPRPDAADAVTPVAPDLDGWRRASGDRGVFEVAWRPVGGEVPRNVDFSIDVVVRRDGAPATDTRLTVRGWMPDHGHGLVRAPIVTALGDGRFGVDALLLHMRGRWQVFFDVTGPGVTDVVEFEVEL